MAGAKAGEGQRARRSRQPAWPGQWAQGYQNTPYRTLGRWPGGGRSRQDTLPKVPAATWHPCRLKFPAFPAFPFGPPRCCFSTLFTLISTSWRDADRRSSWAARTGLAFELHVIHFVLICRLDHGFHRGIMGENVSVDFFSGADSGRVLPTTETGLSRHSAALWGYKISGMQKTRESLFFAAVP